VNKGLKFVTSAVAAGTVVLGVSFSLLGGSATADVKHVEETSKAPKVKPVEGSEDLDFKMHQYHLMQMQESLSKHVDAKQSELEVKSSNTNSVKGKETIRKYNKDKKEASTKKSSVKVTKMATKSPSKLEKKNTTKSVVKPTKNKSTPMRATKSEKKKTTKSVVKPTKNKSTPMRISFMGRTYKYVNGGMSRGQAIIDSNKYLVSTWGGAPVYSGTDNMNTHFIAHNTGAFKGLWGIKIGDKITVTDKNGRAFVYHVTQKIRVKQKNAIGVNDGKSYWNQIVGKGNTERITLQTCTSVHGVMYIIFASK